MENNLLGFMGIVSNDYENNNKWKRPRSEIQGFACEEYMQLGDMLVLTQGMRYSKLEYC